MRRTLTVGTPASTYDLVTLAEAKAHLGIASGDTSKDTLINGYIASASLAIAGECNAVFPKETVIESFYLEECLSDLSLRRIPVQQMTLIAVDGVDLDNSDFIVNTDDGIVTRFDNGSLVNWIGSLIVVTYDGGYPSIPADLKRAANVLIAEYYSLGGRDPRIKSIDIPDVQKVEYWVGSVNNAGVLPPEVQALIGGYVRIAV